MGSRPYLGRAFLPAGSAANRDRILLRWGRYPDLDRQQFAGEGLPRRHRAVLMLCVVLGLFFELEGVPAISDQRHLPRTQVPGYAIRDLRYAGQMWKAAG